MLFWKHLVAIEVKWSFRATILGVCKLLWKTLHSNVLMSQGPCDSSFSKAGVCLLYIYICISYIKSSLSETLDETLEETVTEPIFDEVHSRIAVKLKFI